MWIRISCRLIDDLGRFSCGIVTGWHGWCCGQRWHCRQRGGRFRCHLFPSVRWWCAWSFQSPPYLQILSRAIWARKASVCLILTNHRWGCFYRSLHLLTAQKFDTLHLLFSEFGARILNQIMHSLYCGLWKPACGHFGHIQGQAHVGLFQLYTTSLPCHGSRHVETLQGIRCRW